MSELNIGKKYRFCSEKYIYQFTMVSVDENKITILADENTQIYTVNREEIMKCLLDRTLKELIDE